MHSKKRMICLITVCMILLGSTAPVWGAVSGTFTYGSFIGSNFQAPFHYDDAYFREPSAKYTDSLATMSMCLALSAFASKGTDNYTRKSENLQDLLKQCGFDETTFTVNQGFREKPEMDSIGVGAACKKITDENGEDCWLIACAVRGHGYQSEWASNFTIGQQGEHQGFENAARQVVAFLQDFAEAHPQIEGNVKLWMTGYSRAAAAVNLAAAMIDEGAKISERFELGTDSVYAYCFECPQGTLIDLDSQNSRYRNIFSIVNPADLVTKVAPTLPTETFGFDRYGICMYLPCVLYDGKAAFLEKQKKMLEYYNRLEGTAEHQPAEFQMKKISVMDIWKGNVIIDDHDDAWTQETFLESMISEISEMIGNREEYVSTYQESIRQICRILLGNSKAIEVMNDFASRLRTQAALVAGYAASSPLLGTKPLSDFLEKELIASLEGQGISDYSPEAIHEALENLTNLIINLGIEHPNYVATLAFNLQGIAAGHYPEQCLAWLMSFDPNYAEGNHSNFADGIYRIAAVNGPFEVIVQDEKGRIAGRITDGHVEDIPPEQNEYGTDSAACLINDDGEMTVFLPVRESYTIQIVGKGSGTGDCTIAEISDQFGISRVVKYEDLTLKEGEAVTLSVPAIDEAELKKSYELKDGSSAVYKLTDKDGSSVGTQTLLSGSEVEPTRYRTRVYSSNINYGRVEGGGVNLEGRYEQVRAYPLEGCRFTGWYENKELVSEEESYQFRVEKDRILTAKFEEK